MVDIKEYSVLFSGRVQGVGFRYHVQKQARALRINGWVKNLSDGRVEACVQASDSQWDDLKKRIEDRFSNHITELHINSYSPNQLFDSFEIRR